MERRGFIAGSGAALLAGCSAEFRPRSTARAQIFAARLAEIEQRAGGRLGAYVLDTLDGNGFGWRHTERFGMCSTFKLSLAAYMLREGDAGRIELTEQIPYTRADLLPVSPVTAANVDRCSLSVQALAEAAQLTSDNAAANLLLRRIGGPQALTRFWRELGDRQSRLDRFEPDMNLVPPGEVRDTVLPEAIAQTAARLCYGFALAPASRVRLLGWLARTETGRRRIRAALPPGWTGGDKTGTGIAPGMANKYNDIAVLHPPKGRSPLVVAAFYEAPGYFDSIRPQDEAVLKAVGEVAVQWVI